MLSLLPLLPLHFPSLQGDTATQVAELREELRTGPGPVRIVFFGDSLTAGWGTIEPAAESFPALVRQALEARYPRCALEVIAAGHPGETSEEGLLRADDEVVARRPDVMVLQFGGNDERLKRRPEELTDDLSQLVRRARRAPVGALCILATPPMTDPKPDSPFVRAALRAAGMERVVVANLDQALRSADRDFRGPFPWGEHPGPYSHLIMAREMLRAWDELLGTGPGLSVRLEGYSRMCVAEDRPSVHVVVRNPRAEGLSVDVEVGSAPFAQERTVEVPGGEEVRVEVPIDLPPLGPAARTRVWRIRALGSSAEASASDLDLKWLASAPVVAPQVVEGKLEPETLTWQAFSADCLVKGDSSWKGDADLSARFAVALQGPRLVFVVEVTDDDLTVAERAQHVTDGDSVELALDLRSPDHQGKPVYSEDVVLLLVRPGTTARDDAFWEPLDDRTARLVDVAAESELTGHGYVVRISLPVEALARGEDRSLTGLGFDVHVNDADFGGQREHQMTWAGSQLNFVNPSALASLVDPDGPPALARLCLR